MGEALRRLRVAPFKHRRSRAYQELVTTDLLRLARGAATQFELTVSLAPGLEPLPVNTNCLIMPNGDGGYHVVVGNRVVATVPLDAAAVVKNCVEHAPSLCNALPCRVARQAAFGAVALALAHENVGDE
jgi:hypothetical protein